uniref:LEM domain-containing protein n=1 Tax=Leptobrachium leishanense TaxID=445787 RepID=A0A8C5LWE8_9ANUR
MSDERLRWELMALGFKPGPIIDSTRDVLMKKLQKLRIESTYKWPLNGSHNGGSNGHGSPADAHDYGGGGDDDEEDDGETENGAWWNGSGLRVVGQHVPARRVVAARSWTPGAAPMETSRVQASHAGHRFGERASLGSMGDTSSRAHSSAILSQHPTSDFTGLINRRRFADENTAQSALGNLHDGHNDSAASTTTPTSVSSGHWKLFRSTWSRHVEYYLSRLLYGLSLLLFIAFIGILAAKSGILSVQQESNLLSVDCDGRDDQFCKNNENKVTFRLLSELYDFLSLEAGRYDCGNPAGISSRCVPITKARAHINNVSGFPSEKFDAALEWVLKSDRHFGIWVKDEDTTIVTTRDNAFCLESSRPRLGVFCRIRNAFFTALSTLFLAVFDAVKYHYKEYIEGDQIFPYVGIVHVRDALIPPQNRYVHKLGLQILAIHYTDFCFLTRFVVLA